jgi:hypothetical protein
MAKTKSAKKIQAKKLLPGEKLELAVARVQRMMDPNTTVTHNEKLVDRLRNKRQCDVVIRGSCGGRPILGIIECRDHKRKKGPDAVEAFAKKTEHLGANFRVMVSRKGFTPQALELAKHEFIACFSLLPENPDLAGFSIGDWWYGKIRRWGSVRLHVNFTGTTVPTNDFKTEEVKWQGKPVEQWFIKELLSGKYDDLVDGDSITLRLVFSEVRNLEIGGSAFPVNALACTATRIRKNKRKWVTWAGDAFIDWHEGNLKVPPGGKIVGSAVETDISLWDNYDGEIPRVADKVDGLIGDNYFSP